MESTKITKSVKFADEIYMINKSTPNESNQPNESNESNESDESDESNESDDEEIEAEQLDHMTTTSAMSAVEDGMYFINIKFNEMSGNKHIYSKNDYETIEELYDNGDEYGHPIVYNLIHKLVLNVPKQKKIITFSPDPAISCSTMTGLAEKFNCGQDTMNEKFPKLRVIYLTPSAHLLTNYKEITIENLSNSIISNAMGQTKNSYVGHKMTMTADQFFLIGINDDLIDDDEIEELNNSQITYFTLNQIRKKGIKTIIDYINEKILFDPFMVVFDMASTSYKSCPCVSRFLKDGIKTSITKLNGFDQSELLEIFEKINSENLVGLDITGFDFRIDDKELAYRISCEIARIPLRKLLKIKEKKINIFDESSKFLIFKPIEKQINQANTEIDTSDIKLDIGEDVGWYILRGVSLQLREELISHIDDDTIETLFIDVDGNGEEKLVLITTTTMAEQEEKSVLAKGTTIKDRCLCVNEKISMMFELLNAPANSL